MPRQGLRNVEKRLPPSHRGGATIALKRVYFVRARAVLLPESFEELQPREADAGQPGMEIEVGATPTMSGAKQPSKPSRRIESYRQVHLINRGSPCSHPQCRIW